MLSLIPLTTLTMTTLISVWTAADARRSTAAVVHTLWIAQGSTTVWPDIALLALANLVLVASAAIGTLLVTLRIRTCQQKIKAKHLEVLFGH